MKVAISAQGQDISSQLHPGFGRAPGFIIYDLDTGEQNYLPNSANRAGGRGVGARTAQDVVESGVQAVLTGQVGPKAFSYLRGKDIRIYLTQAATVQEGLQALKDGQLQPTDSLMDQS